jgi:hypothetical protein
VVLNNYYIALLHYPVYNKNKVVVTTAIANMDIHDISRAAKTYGAKRFYIVTPLKAQQLLVGKILHHWQDGYGAKYNPSRKEAFELVYLKDSFDDVLEELSEIAVGKIKFIVTGADLKGKLLSFKTLKNKILEDLNPHLLVFGTGWGITEEIIKRADYLLEPIKGFCNYNHLSVRSAVAITLDRLWGQ